MKKYFNSPKGFTLIELLIVIAILGILATAVLSAINPIEQINRGRDTGSMSDAEQLLGAIMRYNASQGILPWQATVESPRGVAWTRVNNSWLNADGSTPVLSLLGSQSVGTQELQQAFISRITGASGVYNYLQVYRGSGDGDSTYVCFDPQSGSFNKQAQQRCLTKPTDYPSDACSVTNTPYICLP